MGDHGLEVSKYKEEFLNIKINPQGNRPPCKRRSSMLVILQLQADEQAFELWDLTPTAGWEVQPDGFGGSLYSKNLLLCDFMTWMSPPMLPLCWLL